MAGRPPKKRIDYAGWSVDMFDSDTKIDKLLDAHGWAGFGVYFYLCQRAYGSDGYFYKWCYDDCATTARKMGGFMGAGTIKEVVGYCLQIGLFDKGLFDRWGVLSSKGIQRRYWIAISERVDKSVIAEYWLLQEHECKGLVKITLNSDYTPDELHYSADKLNYKRQKEKKTKVHKSKVHYDAAAGDNNNDLTLSNIYELYGKAVNRSLTTIESESFSSLAKEYGVNNTFTATMKALERDKTAIAYIRKILENQSQEKRKYRGDQKSDIFDDDMFEVN